jgi:Reverse transcriptase (RNA-dependent DNA polymerase)
MRQPEGFVVEGKEHMVCKLNKGVYGLKQSGRIWRQTLKKGLESLGFTAGHADRTVFFQFGKENTIELAGWYVDDGLLAADSTGSMERMIQDIGGSFDIQDLGTPERLLGIRIQQNIDMGTIHISQPSFINTIAKRFNITTGKPTLSPMDSTIKLLKASADADTLDISYASLIGSINYCSIATRRTWF